MKANWVRMQGGEECAGVDSEAYGQLGCACTFERGQLAAHLSDGANLCESCWEELCDLMEERDGERPEIS
jgi:hypothetical protein